MRGQHEDLEGWSFPVHVSPGGAARGRSIADQAERTVGWLKTVAGEFAIPDLYVVDRDDWDAVASFPVYGIPHEAPDRIVVGQEPAEFRDVVLDSIDPFLSQPDRAELVRVHGDPVTLGSSADLLVSHEIGHYLHPVGEGGGPDIVLAAGDARESGVAGIRQRYRARSRGDAPHRRPESTRARSPADSPVLVTCGLRKTSMRGATAARPGRTAPADRALPHTRRSDGYQLTRTEPAPNSRAADSVRSGKGRVPP